MIFEPADADVDPPRDGFFHGTKADLRQSEYVRPRVEHGHAPTNAPLAFGNGRQDASDQYVYITRRYLLAWAYAHMSGGLGDPVVLVVDPQGSVEPDPEHSDHMFAFRCRSAQVRAVDTRAPFSAAVAEEGWKRPSADDMETFVVRAGKPVADG